jgi:hypothetical protein
MNRRLSAPFTACLLLFGLTLPAPVTAVKSDCARVGGSAQGTAISPNMFRVAFTGTFSATATATLLEQTQGGDGAIRATTSHVFEINDGSGDGDGVCEAGENCFVTIDRAVLTPTGTPGLFRLNSHMEVVGGEGLYADACGKLVAHGFINFAAGPPTVEWGLSGRVCDCGP